MDKRDLKNDELVIAGRIFNARLLVGTGKYNDFKETRSAIEKSGAEIVTVAIRRTNLGQNQQEPSLLDFLPSIVDFALPYANLESTWPVTISGGIASETKPVANGAEDF